VRYDRYYDMSNVRHIWLLSPLLPSISEES
jgi:hypothetical protein